MEQTRRQTAKKIKHRRKRCGHCDKILLYSAYRAHKDLYYNDSEKKWRNCQNSDHNLQGAAGQTGQMDSSDSIDEDVITDILADSAPQNELQHDSSNWLDLQPIIVPDCSRSTA